MFQLEGQKCQVKPCIREFEGVFNIERFRLISASFNFKLVIYAFQVLSYSHVPIKCNILKMAVTDIISSCHTPRTRIQVFKLFLAPLSSISY